MELSELKNTSWTSDEENDSTRNLGCKDAENSEISICVETLVETHCDKSSDDTIPDSVNGGKCGFKQFVEDSTLRSIALDEIEQLSDGPDGIAGTDGDIMGRTSSTVSSEQAPVKYAVILEWNAEYLRKPEGIFRLALLTCSTMSLACVTIAGTSEIDVLNLPVSFYIRAHIFVTVFALLISVVLFTIYVTSLIQSFPIHWNIIDAGINAVLSILFIFSSSFLIHVQQGSQHKQQQFLSEWTKAQLTLAAVFGYVSTLLCIYLTIVRSCARTSSTTSEDIILTSMRNS